MNQTSTVRSASNGLLAAVTRTAGNRLLLAALSTLVLALSVITSAPASATTYTNLGGMVSASGTCHRFVKISGTNSMAVSAVVNPERGYSSQTVRVRFWLWNRSVGRFTNLTNYDYATVFAGYSLHFNNSLRTTVPGQHQVIAEVQFARGGTWSGAFTVSDSPLDYGNVINYGTQKFYTAPSCYL